MSGRIKVVQVGLGPIGAKITQYLLRRQAFDLVGALDVAPDKAGRDLGELAGGPPIGVPVFADPSRLASVQADVAVVATVSSLEKAKDQILHAVQADLNVVSTCEELASPWKTQPAVAQEIDQAARDHGVSVLGTGVNPGFLMDFLPLALSGACLDVHRVQVERIQDASRRRRPFQAKIGAGLTLDEFHRRVEGKTLRHVGLVESMHMIASRLGWKLDQMEDIVQPVVAQRPLKTPDLSVKPGQAIGVSQTGRGWRDGRELITLIFRATIGEPESYDRIRIQGVPDLDVRFVGGVNGDIATCAIAVNAIPAVVEAQPGLRTMADIAPISCFNASGMSG